MNEPEPSDPVLPQFIEITASITAPQGIILKRFVTDTTSFDPKLILTLTPNNFSILVSRFPGLPPSLDPGDMDLQRLEWFDPAVRYRMTEHFSTPQQLVTPTIRCRPLIALIPTLSQSRRIDCFGTTLIELPE